MRDATLGDQQWEVFMKILGSSVAGLICIALFPGATAEAQELELTHHMVTMSEGETIQTPQGNEVTLRVRSHGSVINDRNGEQYSQWCYGETQGSESGAGVPGAGYCTLVDDEGDAWWVSYIVHADGRPTDWSVIGGTGKFADATGGGTHRVVSERGDGQAWTGRSVGTLKTR